MRQNTWSYIRPKYYAVATLIGLVGVAVVWFSVSNGGSGRLNAQELTDRYDEVRAEIVSGVEDGGVLRLEMETFSRGMIRPSERFTDASPYPDRIRTETWIGATDAGNVDAYEGATFTTSGELLSMMTVSDRKQIIVDAATGEEQIIPLPGRTSVNFFEWLDQWFERPDALLQKDFEVVGTGVLAGSESVILERVLTPPDSPTIRQEIEFSMSNPLYARESHWEVANGDETLVKELTTLSAEVMAPGSEPDW